MHHYTINSPVIFRGKPNYHIVNVNDNDPIDPTYVVADATGRVYSFWVPDSDLQYDHNTVTNPS